MPEPSEDEWEDLPVDEDEWEDIPDEGSPPDLLAAPESPPPVIANHTRETRPELYGDIGRTTDPLRSPTPEAHESLLAGAIRGLPLGEGFDEAMSPFVPNAGAQLNAAEAAHPGASLLGRATTTLATAPLLPAAALAQTGLGAAEGFLASEGDIGDRMQSAAIGAGGAYGASRLGQYLSGIAKRRAEMRAGRELSRLASQFQSIPGTAEEFVTRIPEMSAETLTRTVDTVPSVVQAMRKSAGGLAMGAAGAALGSVFGPTGTAMGAMMGGRGLGGAVRDVGSAIAAQPGVQRAAEGVVRGAGATLQRTAHQAVEGAESLWEGITSAFTSGRQRVEAAIGQMTSPAGQHVQQAYQQSPQQGDVAHRQAIETDPEYRQQYRNLRSPRAQ